MQHLTTLKLTFVDRDSLLESGTNGNPAGVRSWASGTAERVIVTVPDGEDGIDEFAAEESGRERLAFRGLDESSYSLEEVEVIDRFDAEGGDAE